MHAAKLVATELGRRISDPDRIAAESSRPRDTPPSAATRPWRSYSLAQGYAGIACAFGELSYFDSESEWDLLAHRYLTAAVISAEDQNLSPGLFGGLTGLLAAAHCLSREGSRYRSLVASLETTLAAALCDRQKCEFPHGIPTAEFDTISGTSGVVGCLLLDPKSARIRPLAAELASELVALAGMSNGVPHWYTPARFQHGLHADNQRNDTLNYGMAHGLPGAIAALALAELEGIEVADAESAVCFMADWLLTHRADDAFGCNWPATTVVGSEEAAPTRSAWCYGAPGIACALRLAGAAFNRKDWREDAFCAMEAVYRRPIAERRIESPTFCHGVAGLLQITTAFLRETGEQMFAQAQEELVEQIVASFDVSTPFGVQSIDGPGERFDRAGFLDGAAGTMAALASACTTRRSPWERVFLIS